MEEIHPKSEGEKIIEEIIQNEPKGLKVLDMEEIKKPTKGQDLLNRIKEGELFNKDASSDPINLTIEKEDVEVIKGKIVSFSDLEKNQPLPLDKFGVPIPKNRKTWDRI